MVIGPIAFGPVRRQAIMGEAHEEGSGLPCGIQEVREKQEGPESSALPQARIPSDLTYFYQGPPPKGSTTSK